MGLELLSPENWKNKQGTEDRRCPCGSWKQYWINNSKKSWPPECSVENCSNPATLGAHVINVDVPDEYIVPMCDSCNKLSDEFSLKGNITLISANVSNTCGQKK